MARRGTARTVLSSLLHVLPQEGLGFTVQVHRQNQKGFVGWRLRCAKPLRRCPHLIDHSIGAANGEAPAVPVPAAWSARFLFAVKPNWLAGGAP